MDIMLLNQEQMEDSAQMKEYLKLSFIFKFYCKQDYIKQLGKIKTFQALQEYTQQMCFASFKKLNSDYNTLKTAKEIQQAFAVAKKSSQFKPNLGYEQFVEALIILLGGWP